MFNNIGYTEFNTKNDLAPKFIKYIYKVNHYMKKYLKDLFKCGNAY